MFNPQRAVVMALAAVLSAPAAGFGITGVYLYPLSDPYANSYATPSDAYRPVSGGRTIGIGPKPGAGYRALLWDGSGVTDLTPTGYKWAYGYGISGQSQVGYGTPGDTDFYHALLWNGTNAAVDLNPAGFTHSFAYGVGGGQQVGYGSGPATNTFRHALLWHGTNAAIDLNPAGFSDSFANNTDGRQQVGSGFGTATGGAEHALLWNGTNAVVDLNPRPDMGSVAYNVADGQQVGYGIGAPTGHSEHAMLWNGTSAAIDLNPAGYTKSWAYGVGGGLQAGYGYGPASNDLTRALLWNGNAESVIDLQALLPATMTVSYAYAVEGDTVYGLARSSGGFWHAVAWTGVPEPTGLSLLAVPAVLAGGRRRRRPAV